MSYYGVIIIVLVPSIFIQFTRVKLSVTLEISGWKPDVSTTVYDIVVEIRRIILFGSTVTTRKIQFQLPGK